MMSSLQWLRLQIRIQRIAGRIAHFPLGASLMFIIIRGFRYRIENLKELRAMYHALAKEPGPLMICCNHLSFMDPVLLHHAFGNHWKYFWNYKVFPWNLAASEYATNPIFGPVCWFSKVLFIRRGSRPRYLEDLFQVVSELLRNGEVVNIFPEGRRSRTGRFDDRKLAFGIGQILTRVPEDFTVLCVYLRAKQNAGFGNFPKRGTEFIVRFQKVKFSQLAGTKDAGIAVTQKIAQHILELEKQFFNESHGKESAAL
ncbi:MAG: 1-acyl-sn-glycerol-3-phosphate acyltransferase [Bdellovibrionales bacterium]|nr:1-acyl-sn-glycerol-3-phosphate acyltransferase [Bdellovibrionales bacterium]